MVSVYFIKRLIVSFIFIGDQIGVTVF